MIIDDYSNYINSSNSLEKVSKFIIDKFIIDMYDYEFNSAFMACLSENKKEERFKVLSANGRFLNKNATTLITSEVITNIGIVFSNQTNLYKDKFYINLIKKDDINVFIYLEFDNILNDYEKSILDSFFLKLNNLIIDINWNI